MPRLACYILILISIALYSCSKQNNKTNFPPGEKNALYFPPLTGNDWATVSPSTLGWNESELNNLYGYLSDKKTKAFIILKDGKIVSEKYYGTFTSDSLWFWASAGKTLTAFLVGIAQQQGLLNIHDSTSRYLGTGWTSEPADRENLITISHQLTMTSGIDDDVQDLNCTSASCLHYKADAGTRWAYHNAVYSLLIKVVEKASGSSYNNYFQQNIRDRIGMNGIWIQTSNNENVYYSNARSMARFGLLMLNKGNWNGTSILSDSAFFRQQVSSSQAINPAYGYLTWLNGKTSYMLPALQTPVPGSLIPEAPADMFAALGKYDQKMYVVPSQNLVVIRMGEDAGGVRPTSSSFDNELWARLKIIIGY